MNSLLLGIAVGSLIGIIIGYFLWKKSSIETDVQPKPQVSSEPLSGQSQKDKTLDKRGSRMSVSIPINTEFIDNITAQSYQDEFTSFCTSTAPLNWNKEQRGWRVNASKLRAVLDQEEVGNPNELIESVLIELGINPENPSQVTLLISGLELDGGVRYKVMGKSDTSRWGAGIREHSDPSKDYILEYVDPCIPPCSGNNFA